MNVNLTKLAAGALAPLTIAAITIATAASASAATPTAATFVAQQPLYTDDPGPDSGPTLFQGGNPAGAS